MLAKYRAYLILLILAGLGLGAYIYFVELKGGEKSAQQAEDRSRLTAVTMEQIEGLSLAWNGQVLRIGRQKNGSWRFSRPLETEAKATEVERVLEKVLALRSTVTIGTGITDRSQYGLQPPRIVVTLDGAGRRILEGFDFGESNPAGDNIYVMRHTDSTVVLVGSVILQNVQKTMYDLRDRDLNGFEREALASVTVSHAGGEYTLRRTAYGWWLGSPVLAPADRDLAGNILDRLIYNKAEEYVEEAPRGLARYGLQNPRMRVTVTDSAGRTDGFILGGKTPDRTFFAMRNGRKPIFTVSSHVFETLAKKPAALRDTVLVRFYKTDLTALTVVAGDQRIALTARDGIWQVPAGKSDSARVSMAAGECLTALENLRPVRTAADHPANLSVYGLDKTGLRVTLSGPSGDLPVLLFGTHNGQTYFRFDLGGPVYEVRSETVEKLKAVLALQ